jgi:hypothetical protein
MSLVGVSAVRCAKGHHQWEPVEGWRRPGLRRERCRGCGASGVWMPAADFLGDDESRT